MLYYTEMLLLRFLTTPTHVLAQCVDANGRPYRCITIATGVRIPFVQAISNVVLFLATSAVGVCTVLFLVGAAQLTMSRGDQTKVDNGKKLMISSLVGLAIVATSYAIVTTVLYFLYEWAP